MRTCNNENCRWNYEIQKPKNHKDVAPVVEIVSAN